MTSSPAEIPANRKSRLNLPRLAVLLLAGTVIGLWLAVTPSGLMGKADAIAYAVCHRISLRSFHLGDRPLPLCARCSGMYLGALLTLIYYTLIRPRAGLYPNRRLVAIFVLFGFSWAIDGLNSYMHLFPSAPHLYQPSNTLRIITGSLIGIALATLVYPVFNQTVWRKWRHEPVLRSPGELVKLVILAAGLVGLMITENPLILYPMALLSSFGVLVLLALIYTTMSLTILRLDNRADSWRDLVLPLVTGLALGIVQITLLSLGRYLLTVESGLIF